MKKNVNYASEAYFTKVLMGRTGGTFAHPVIGLAYAKYLSPEFHIWCNERLLASGLIDMSGTAGF
jgi:hypothetical protein